MAKGSFAVSHWHWLTAKSHFWDFLGSLPGAWALAHGKGACLPKEAIFAVSQVQGSQQSAYKPLLPAVVLAHGKGPSHGKGSLFAMSRIKGSRQRARVCPGPTHAVGSPLLAVISMILAHGKDPFADTIFAGKGFAVCFCPFA
nr:unnamed protein product [Digitaria exilis]